MIEWRLQEAAQQARARLRELLKDPRSRDSAELDDARRQDAQAWQALGEATGRDWALPFDVEIMREMAGLEETLVQVRHRAAVVFPARSVALNDSGFADDLGWAIAWFDGCWQTRFGYPNEEAICDAPPYPAGINVSHIQEVFGGSWVRALRQQNAVAFPGVAYIADFRHFFLPFKDTSAEVLARSIRLEVVTSYREALERACSELSGVQLAAAGDTPEPESGCSPR